MTLKEEALKRAAPAAMDIVSELSKNINPENEIAGFLEQHLGELFVQRTEDGMNMAHGLIEKMAIDEANKDPDYVVSKLLQFYESFRVWYSDYMSTPPAPTQLPEVDNVDETLEDTHITS